MDEIYSLNALKNSWRISKEQHALGRLELELARIRHDHLAKVADIQSKINSTGTLDESSHDDVRLEYGAYQGIVSNYEELWPKYEQAAKALSEYNELYINLMAQGDPVAKMVAQELKAKVFDEKKILEDIARVRGSH